MKARNSKIAVLLICLLLVLAACSPKNKDKEPGNSGFGGETNLEFPEKSINLITPFAAGGISDILARGIAEYAKDYVGETVVVVNREGAGGTIGTGEGARAKADGYTVTLATAAGFTTQPYLREIAYELDDFKILTSVSYATNLIAVSADSPYHSLKDIVDASEKEGWNFSYGQAGVGSFGDLAQRALFSDLGIKAENVAFNGSNPAIAALLGGHIDMSAVLPTDIVQHVKDGKLRVIATLAPERIAEYPDVPTIKEAVAETGLEFRYADHDFSASYFLLVPKDTPSEIVDYLSVKFTETFNDTEFKEFAERTEMYLRVEEGEKVFNEIREQSEVYKTIIDEQGIGEQS